MVILTPKPLGKTLQERHTQHLATHASLYHLAEETGGLFFANTNDVNRSLNWVLEDLKGYYLIGFIPEDVGFEADEDESRFQRIEVKLKRPGLKVRARAGAFGAPRTAMAALDRTPKQKLFSTLMSPFAGDIGLNLTCLVGYDPSQGLFVRSLLHVDAQDLSFREDSGGSKVAGSKSWLLPLERVIVPPMRSTKPLT